MACCALAAFLVSQLFALADWVREHVLGVGPATVTASAAAAWRLGDAPASVREAALWTPRRFAMAAAVGTLAFGLSYAALERTAGVRLHAWQIPYLCSPDAPFPR
jgi:hypothetical protein